MGQRRVPFSPEVSWLGGQPGSEYRDYGYQAQPGQQYQPQAAPTRQPALPSSRNYGEHPYAGYDAVGYTDGYGDPGYSDPGYDGPASQDAGVAGTRTVRGFVESEYAEPPGGYAGPGRGALPPAGRDYPQSEYGQPAGYAEPVDYSQPLRYDDDPGYLPPGHPSGSYPVQGGPLQAPYEPGYQEEDYDSGPYNGSELSRPGIGGPGYDLSEIIGTSDFPSFGYDEPSVERLSYDDPRYDEGYDNLGSRYAGSRSDETRLDSFWPGDGDPSRGSRGGSRTDGGAPGASRGRSAFESDGPGAGAGGGLSAETRLDLGYRVNQTRFDVPVLSDETRLDNMSALAPGRAATGLLERPASWADETSLDSFAGVDIDEFSVGFHPGQSRAVATALREIPVRDDTGAQRATGRRRGRSSDRRQWVALGAVVLVAGAAITGVLSKFAFAGPSGPAHSISTPTHLPSYTRNPSLEKAMDLAQLRAEVVQGSSGQASDIQSAVYSQGNLTPGAGGSQQIFMFVGGHLANSDPASSISSFEKEFPAAKVMPTGAQGGEEACVTTTAQGESVSMCAWFDNDTFGTLVSPTMSTTALAGTLNSVRPGIEQVTRQ